MTKFTIILLVIMSLCINLGLSLNVRSSPKVNFRNRKGKTSRIYVRIEKLISIEYLFIIYKILTSLLIYNLHY